MEQTASGRVSPLVAGVAASATIVVLVGIGAFTGLVPLVGSERPHSATGPSAGPAESALESTRTAPLPERGAGSQVCAKCGVVESVRTFGTKREATNREETVYRVTIRMDDGSYRTISHPVAPGYGVGERVRIIDGSVVPRG